MARHTMNPAYGRMLDRAEEAEGKERPSGEIRRLEIEPVGEGRFRVVCEYEGGRHTTQDLDAGGAHQKFSELTGEGGDQKPEHALAGLIPEDATKGKVKVSFKRGGSSADEDES